MRPSRNRLLAAPFIETERSSTWKRHEATGLADLRGVLAVVVAIQVTTQHRMPISSSLG